VLGTPRLACGGLKPCGRRVLVSRAFMCVCVCVCVCVCASYVHVCVLVMCVITNVLRFARD